jgi:signal transduction histidine kinase
LQNLSTPTRAAIASNSALISRPFEVEFAANVHHPGHASAVEGVGRPTVRPPALSRAEQIALAYRTRDDRLAVISHELRNSLSVVRYAARLFGAQETVSGVIASAQLLIERQVGQMSRLIEDLLDGSRISGPGSLQRQRIDLRDLVKQVTEGIALDIGRRGHRLTVNLPDYPVWLDADPGRLEQVFSNLLMNAAKYSHDHGDITLTVQRESDYASVRVRDCGIGIAAEILPCVFGLFVQAEPSAPRSEAGHGIGLAVVRSFVELHGGSVTATSGGLGRGSEFTVLLPACADAAPTDQPNASSLHTDAVEIFREPGDSIAPTEARCVGICAYRNAA